ncbi:MAG: universal stress protein [Thaumarchaeota archaeon]|nr:universal stress protein [Nitrososphaerota archaeon]
MVAEEVYERILVGYDGSDNAKRALKKTIQLSKSSSEGELFVVVAFDSANLYVLSMGQYYASARGEMGQHAQDLLSEALRIVKQAGIKTNGSVEEGRPADMILAKAIESRADLIVVGRRGIRGIERFLMGSVSSSIVSHSEVDVLVVK